MPSICWWNRYSKRVFFQYSTTTFRFEFLCKERNHRISQQIQEINQQRNAAIRQESNLHLEEAQKRAALEEARRGEADANRRAEQVRAEASEAEGARMEAERKAGTRLNT